MAIHNGSRIAVHERISGGRAVSQQPYRSGARGKVCTFWLQGRCNRSPCKFIHQMAPSIRAKVEAKEISATPVTANVNPGPLISQGTNSTVANGGDGFSLVATVEGHRRSIKGIALPPGSDKLFTSSSEGNVKIWDFPSGQCIEVLNLGCEISCLVGDEAWVFVGVPGAVKAWNSQTGVDLSLDVPGGRQVYSLALGNVHRDEVLFAGVNDGSILAWIWNAAGKSFEPASGDAISSFTGAHRLAVVTMVVGNELLYSGSLDCTIKVWHLATLKCLQTLSGHCSPVTSIIFWDQFMLSGSLDGTVKVWAGNMESGQLDLTWTHKVEHGVVALGGMFDAKSKPILLCSCKDNTVHIYDLPSFSKRGRIFSSNEVRQILTGPRPFFFTGDEAGWLKVWTWI